MPDRTIEELRRLAGTNVLKDVCLGRKSGVEENIKVKIVLKVLELLGYDTVQDLDFEHHVENQRADIAILLDGTPRLIVETKSLEKNLEDYKVQALDYARRKGITWVILTNGVEFRLYKSFIEGIEDKRNRPLFFLLLSDIEDGFQSLARYVSKANLAGIEEVARPRVAEINKAVTQEELLETLTQSKRELFLDLRTQFDERYPRDSRFRAKIDAWASEKQLDRDDTWIRQYRSDRRFRRRVNQILQVEKDLDDDWFKRYREDVALQKTVRERFLQNDIFGDWIGRLCAAAAYAFINRLLFLRISEDRGFVQPPKLSSSWLMMLDASSTHETVLNLIKAAFSDIASKFAGVYKIPLFDSVALDDLRWNRQVISRIVLRTLKFNFKQITRDIIGLVYQRHLSREVRRSVGGYYTPEPIINFILDHTPIPGDGRLLDPACGSGGFLISTYDRLKRKLLQEGWDERAAHHRILQESLFGIDIDSFAVQLTVMNLLMKDLDNPTSSLRIAEGNSLISSLDIFETSRPVHTVTGNDGGVGVSVNEILSERYDAVIGNPPYVNIAKTNATYSDAISSAYKDIATGIVNSSSMFVKRGIDLLKDGGTLGFIVPKPLVWVDSYEGIRKYILANCRIRAVADVGRAFGEEVGYEQVIIVLQKDSDVEKQAGNDVEVAIEISDNEALQRGDYRTHHVKQSLFTPDKAFPIYVTPELVPLYKKLQKDSTPLMDLADIFRGLPIQKEKSILAAKKRNDNYVKIIRGKHINRYLTETSEFVDTSATKFSRRKAAAKRMMVPKIIIQRLVTSRVRIVGTYDYEGLLNFDTITNILVRDSRLVDKYVLALINSKMMSLYIRDFVFVRSFLTMDMDRSYIGALPIRIAEKGEQESIANLADEMIALKSKLYKLGDDADEAREKAKIRDRIRRVNGDIEDRICRIYDVGGDEKTLISEKLGYEVEEAT